MAYKIRLITALIILALIILGVFGFYPVNILDMQFSALFARLIVDFSVIALVLFSILLISTFLFGRFYCSLICPFGIAQELFALVLKKKNSLQKNLPVKYFIMALSFGFLIGGSVLLIRYIDPYTLFGSAFSASLLGLITLACVLILVFFKNRYFCTNICPVGAVLGLISKFSLNKININSEKCVSCGLCAKVCPSGCINHKEKTVDNEACIKCLKCLNECKKDAINYGIPPKKEVKFSPKRRNILVAASVLLLFGGAIKAGVEIGKNFASKIKNIILPPGAKNANRMANKCLNCNLCIENCPNKILSKANSDFCAVHIDYTKGEGFCKFDCNECSKVCPSGAIKRISLEEKQKTRIAIASFKKEICTRCETCVQKCPTGAISLDDKKEPILDATKCIGCNKCAKSCRFDAIEVFSVNEQQII